MPLSLLDGPFSSVFFILFYFINFLFLRKKWNQNKSMHFPGKTLKQGAPSKKKNLCDTIFVIVYEIIVFLEPRCANFFLFSRLFYL